MFVKGVSMPVKVNELLCQTRPDYVPFIDGNKSISFVQFQSDVQRFCAAFQKIDEPSVILHIAKDIYLFYVCFFGLLHAQKDIVLPAHLTDATLAGLKSLTPVLVSNVDFVGFDGVRVNPTAVITDEKATLSPITGRFVSFFTSGSTGAPKQIKKNFDTLAAEVYMHSEIQQSFTAQNPVFIATILPNHMFGMLWRFLFPLCNGITQDLDTVISPEDIQQKQRLYDKVLLATTPTFMNEMAAYAEQYQFLENCLAIYSSGSLLSRQTSEEMGRLFGVSPYEVFASTETGGIAFRQQANGDLFHVFPCVKIEKNEQSCIRVIRSDFSYMLPFDMQDVIQSDAPAPTDFALLGRNDRVVKIAENRLNLNDMETKLNQHEWVAESYILPMQSHNNTLLGAVICLTEAGKEFLKTQGKVPLVRLFKQHLSLWYNKNILPKKVRFVYRIYKNPQGKILKKEMENLFDSPVAEPVIENLKHNGDVLTADLTFLKDSAYFQGHFANHPILPGVMQLHTAFYFLKHFFGVEPERYAIDKLKFAGLILPDTTVHFKMEKRAPDAFDFSFYNDNKVCSSGKIVEEK